MLAAFLFFAGFLLGFLGCLRSLPAGLSELPLDLRGLRMRIGDAHLLRAGKGEQRGDGQRVEPAREEVERLYGSHSIHQKNGM